jgi:hypothetical protein
MTTYQERMSRLAEMERAERDASFHLQAAGLPVLSTSPYTDPLKYRVDVNNFLASALPESAPKVARETVTAGVAEMMPETFRKIEAATRDATIQAVRASGELRPIIEKDRTGREITQFIGSKRSWMAPFSAEPQEMIGVNGRRY